MWQMRIVINGYTVRIHGDYHIHRFFKGFWGLLRQPIDQIYAARFKAVFSGPIHYRLSFFNCLDSMDSFLNCKVKVLNAKTNPIKTKLS